MFVRYFREFTLATLGGALVPVFLYACIVCPQYRVSWFDWFKFGLSLAVLSLKVSPPVSFTLPNLDGFMENNVRPCEARRGGNMS